MERGTGLAGSSASRENHVQIDNVYTPMYIHRMVRTQLYIDDDMHRRLKSLARKQGRTVSDLVREAVARVYAPGGGANQRLETLRAVEGIWRDHEEVADAHAYVRRMRADTHRTKPRR